MKSSMQNKAALASLLFAATILIVLWISGSSILFFNEELTKYGATDIRILSLPLATQIGYSIALPLLAVALSCAFAEPCRKYYVRTFGILGACSLLAFLGTLQILL